MNSTSLLKRYTLLLLTIVGLLSFTACNGKNSNVKIDGVDGPNVTLLEDNLMISMVLENVQLDGGLRYNIPKYPNSYIEISPDLQSDGTLMSVSISIDDMFNDDLYGLDPQKLPGGRPLPGVVSGSLPAVAFSIEKFNNMSVYVGPEVFGIFVPVNLNVENSILSFRYYISEKRAGTVSVVGNDQDGENGGVLLMLDIKGKWKKLLKKAQKRY
ncbi:hypothetical protein [Halobacteriovorax sp. HLS]|uniref:hypothetical protein n=1 Tax=Halobacteriovorax sp. HLS TaxID=2234000 RepID=UPI000FD6E87B|nr:hypothetical protein [Halobacteriovorax sp. HLS]